MGDVSTPGPGEDHRCTECGSLTERVTLGGGGRIGWFCYVCDIFYPGEGVQTR